MHLHTRTQSAALRPLLTAAFVATLYSAAVVPAAAQQTPAEGAVYTATNATLGNKVAIFERALDGTVTFDQLVPTGGFGTGAALGNQGAVTLSEDHRFLFVVNPGSDDLSVFRVDEDGLTLVDLAPTGGTQPVSVAQSGEFVYVANEGNDSIRGFRLAFDGTLKGITNGWAFLGNSGAGIAQIAFGPDGRSLYVTGRNTQTIDVFRLDLNGAPVRHRVVDSNGAVPFGFTFGNRGQLIVTEGGGLDGLGAVTSYNTSSNGKLFVISPSATTTQAATCWVVADPTGRLIFVSNTSDDSISSFSVGFDGTLSLIDAESVTTAAGPRDMAMTADGRFLYVLDEVAGIIGDYVVGSDGSLVGIPGGTDLLETGATGLAAR